MLEGPQPSIGSGASRHDKDVPNVTGIIRRRTGRVVAGDVERKLQALREKGAQPEPVVDSSSVTLAPEVSPSTIVTNQEIIDALLSVDSGKTQPASEAIADVSPPALESAGSQSMHESLTTEQQAEVKRLSSEFKTEELVDALKKGVSPEQLLCYCLYQESLADRQKLPYIDLLVHAQRQEHYFAMLNQVAKAGEVTAQSLALRSKEENNMLGVGVNSYSPNGQGGFLEAGLPTISTNNSEVQNGYGEYIWVMPTATVLSQEGYRFTSMAPVDTTGIAKATGEMGIITPASELLQTTATGVNNKVRDVILGEVRQKVTEESVRVGISLNAPEVFCLVPLQELPQIVDRINALPIAEEQKNILRLQLIPYKEDDSLGSSMLEELKNNPQQYAALASRGGVTVSTEQLAIWQAGLESQNFIPLVDSPGYKYADIPFVEAVTLEGEISEATLWEARAERLHLREIAEQIDKDMQVFFWRHLTTLTKHYIPTNVEHRQPLKQAVCRAAIESYKNALSKTKEQLDESDKALLVIANIDLEKVGPGEAVLAFFKNKYFSEAGEAK